MNASGANIASSNKSKGRWGALTGRTPEDRAVRLTLIGAGLAVLVPVLIFGPWLPLIDLVSFVGLYSYPPQQSDGPFHYYLFQFSYSGVLIVSRLLCDLSLPVRFQVPFYYLLQMAACLAIVHGVLRHLVSNAWLRCCGLALGSLALWDGIFLWGGPLGFSLGTCCVNFATFLAMRDAADPRRNASTLIAALVMFSLCCHPFMLLFALVLCGLRFVFDARRRWQTVGLAAAAALFAYIILRDSPAAEVGGATGGLRMLFGFKPSEMAIRVLGLFQQDALFAQILFGTTPIALYVLFGLLSVLHVVGFVVCPYIAVVERQSLWRRMLATLNVCAGTLYLFSWTRPTTPVGDWSQRVLTAYAPFTYLAGFVALVYVIGRIRAGRFSAERPMPRLAWIVPVGLLAFVVTVQAQVFRFSRVLAANIDGARAGIVKSGVANAYLVASGMDNVRPFYLRCIPFVLFSDRELVARNILLSPEWHVQPRHPTRITEAAVDLGRSRYQAEFSTQNSAVAIQLTELPPDRFPVPEHTNEGTWLTPTVMASAQFDQGLALLNSGVNLAAWEHFNTAIHLLPNFVSAWDNGGVALSRAGRIDEGIVCFQTALKYDPKAKHARINLAFLLIGLGRDAEARAHIDELLRQYPKDPAVLSLVEKAREKPAAPPK